MVTPIFMVNPLTSPALGTSIAGSMPPARHRIHTQARGSGRSHLDVTRYTTV